MKALHKLEAALAGLAGLGIILFCSGHARADDRADYVRLQYTEFCAVVKPPPQELILMLEQAAKADPETWTASARWMERLAEAYNKRKCGDA